MTRQSDVGQRQQRHFYFRNGTLDFLAGWLLGYAQQGGLSPGELYHCFNRVDERHPASWVQVFTGMLADQQFQARKYDAQDDHEGAGARYLAATVAARAALNMLDPTSAEAQAVTTSMEEAFQAAMQRLEVPLEPWNIPFGSKHLPAYVSAALAPAPVLFVVVGGGDTYREDLWFFGGKAALERGYAVFMADLPGQGSTPHQGLHFGPETLDALDTALTAVRARGFGGQMVLCAWSGGGYFTTKYLEGQSSDNPHQIAAWIASTPIHDMARLMQLAMPALLRGDPSGWWQRLAVRLAGNLNPVLQASLRKYDWQFGPGGLAGVLTTFAQLAKVDVQRLNVPLLALVGLSEDAESRRQAQEVYDAVKARQPRSELLTFPPESGADAHCQVNNFPLAFHHIFRWLEGLELRGGLINVQAGGATRPARTSPSSRCAEGGSGAGTSGPARA